MRFDEEFKKTVINESWDSIAQMAASFQIELDSDNKQARKLKKELSVVKHIVSEHLSKEGAERFITPALLVRLIEAIEHFESAFEKHNIKRKDFLIFLKALLFKIKKEKLYVGKPLERQIAFKKMKYMLENGNGHL